MGVKNRTTYKKKQNPETGALIIASRKGENEEIDFPAMYPFHNITAIKWQISMLRRADVSPIYILCGYQKEILKSHLVHNGVRFIEDEDYEKHDLSRSIEFGLEMIKEQCTRLLIIPVEYTAFSLDTVKQVMGCKDNIMPIYENQSGYPILYVDGKFDTYRRAGRISVDDPGICLSLNEKDGEEKIQQYLKKCNEINGLHVKTKVILTKENDFFGPGIYHLLKNIEKTGSIQASVEKMGMSYSKGWKMIQKAEDQMTFSFIERTKGGKLGGGANLTEEGKRFLDAYEKLLRDVETISDNFFNVYFQSF